MLPTKVNKPFKLHRDFIFVDNTNVPAPRFTLDPSYAAADLETLMRAALGALASFNEDERMILTRCACHTEDGILGQKQLKNT